MRVDSHQHFWQWSKGWFKRPEPVLSLDYLPGDLQPILEAHGIDKSVLVQTAESTGETDFLLELAAGADFIAGVVGWLDLDSPCFPRDLERYGRNRRFLAVRPMLQSLPEDDWIVRPKVIESLAHIAEKGLAFDFLTLTRHLPYVLKALERVPKLRAVIDHLSKPEIREGKLDPWRNLMREVAAHPGVHCKLSGMLTEADPRDCGIERLRPYADHILEHFGAERVMFGSDWPVCLLAADYDEVLSVTQSLVKDRLGPAAEEAVFGGTAARFYRIG